MSAAEQAAVQELRRGLARFASRHIDAQRNDKEGGFPDELLEALRDMGIFGLSIPEEWGGSGLGLASVCSVVSEIASLDRSLATAVGLHVGMGTRTLSLFGTDEQRERFLKPLASGEYLAAFAATEPGAGSDLSAITTRAVPRGDGLVVDGSKVFVTNGGFAQVFSVLARMPEYGEAAVGLVMLRPDDPGVEIGPPEDKLGIRASSTTTLHLDAVAVPRDRVIGSPGQATLQLPSTLGWGRALVASGCSGVSGAALASAVAHTAGRIQFGAPLSKLAVVREHLADMDALCFAMEAMVHRASDEGVGEGEFTRRTCAAKAFNSEGCWEVCDTSLQLHGGTGFIEESGMPVMLCDARINRIFDGANDMLFTQLGANEAFGRAKHPPSALRERLDAHIAALRKQFGFRLARNYGVMWRLGQAAVMVEAAEAAVDLAQSEADVLRAEHWQDMVSRRLEPLMPTPDRGRIDALFDALRDRMERA